MNAITRWRDTKDVIADAEITTQTSAMIDDALPVAYDIIEDVKADRETSGDTLAYDVRRRVDAFEEQYGPLAKYALIATLARIADTAVRAADGYSDDH